MSYELHEECGVFGVFGHPEAANLTYLGLHALQHRGQESAGIVASDGTLMRAHRQMGLVADVFTERVLAGLPGDTAIGHVRYSTAGESRIENAQPLMVKSGDGQIAVAHNGNLVNADVVRKDLERRGSIFSTTSDTEVLVHLLAHEREGALTDKLVRVLKEVRGAYSLLFLTPAQMIAARDPLGFRPLILGRLRNAFVVASETCALDLIEAEFVREIAPGEMICIDEHGLRSFKIGDAPRTGMCTFEMVYFARPDSQVFGKTVYETRKQLGRVLAQEHAVDGDVVVPVPDSGVAAAVGYAEESKIPFDLGLIRSHYVGRTFIEPQQSIRHFGVKLKLNTVRAVLKDKRVIVVDDSIVRGTTSRKIIKMIRAAGAREVHMRITSPPTRWPCYYGVDTPTRQELIASSHDIDEIARYITADTLGYLSLEGMHKAVGAGRGSWCDACWSGDYLVKFPGMVGPEDAPRLVQVGGR